MTEGAHAKKVAASPRASSASSNLGVVHVTSKSEALDRLRRKQHEEQVKGIVAHAASLS